MKYDFDVKIPRENTNCVKYDLRKNVFGNPDVLPMWVADMDFATPDFAREAVMERAQHPVYGYHFKDKPYFTAIQGWLKRRHQWEVPTEWMSFVPGVVCGFNMAVLAFTKEGDEVVIQSPVYPPFHHAASSHQRKLVYNSLKIGKQGYEMDFDLLEKQAKTAKMLILCNPYNPVGRCWTREELLHLSEICLRNNVLVIADEIHCDLVLPGYKHTPYATLNEEAAQHCIVFHAASKTLTWLDWPLLRLSSRTRSCGSPIIIMWRRWKPIWATFSARWQLRRPWKRATSGWSNSLIMCKVTLITFPIF